MPHGQNYDRMTRGNGGIVGSREKPTELGQKPVPPRDSHKNHPVLNPGAPGQDANTKPPELWHF